MSSNFYERSLLSCSLTAYSSAGLIFPSERSMRGSERSVGWLLLALGLAPTGAAGRAARAPASAWPGVAACIFVWFWARADNAEC